MIFTSVQGGASHTHPLPRLIFKVDRLLELQKCNICTNIKIVCWLYSTYKNLKKVTVCMSAKRLATPIDVSHDFPQPLQVNARLVPTIKSWPLLYVSVPFVD